jgi:hypothetical protein
MHSAKAFFFISIRRPGRWAAGIASDGRRYANRSWCPQPLLARALNPRGVDHGAVAAPDRRGSFDRFPDSDPEPTRGAGVPGKRLFMVSIAHIELV